MDKIQFASGLIDRLSCGTINGKPYILVSDAKYIIENINVLCDDKSIKNDDEPNDELFSEIKSILDRRPGEWPSYYDNHDAKEYHEWFIKGTNMKLGFDYIDGATNEHCWYKIVCDGYDQMEPYESESEFLTDIQWMLKNKELSWRYYE